ncbi:MAG: D-alanyl-D-alanine carboxypeptidase [Oscillospiraceae bacterium]|nr:D-alanyl-D-alanine carboxypeptidase [Oscillospiraceae bacterium]
MKNVFCCFVCIALLFSFPVGAVSETPETPLEPYVSAVSAVLINADTGAVVFEKNSREQRAPASVTKIMSALLTLEAGGLDRQFTVDSMAIRVEGTSMGLREGDIVTRRILTQGMLLPSGNDASQAAAVSVSGSIPEFVKLMNSRAAQLGLSDTRFANPSGLDADGHYSTAYDLGVLAIAALSNPDFAAICKQQVIKTEYGNPPYTRWLQNNNKLLHLYEGVFGVKTGFTDNAGRCLVSAAERDGITLIAVTLKAPDDWDDHMRMFDYGFSVVQNQLIDYDLSDTFIEIAGSTTGKTHAAVRLASYVSMPLTNTEMRLVEIEISLVPFIYAGFEEGEQVGLLRLYYNGKLFKTAPIVTAESCDNPTEKLRLTAALQQFWRRAFF